MKRYALTFLFGMLLHSQLLACMGAYLFKIFPVGVLNGKIITIDVKLSRSDYTMMEMPSDTAGSIAELSVHDMEMNIRWVLESFLSVYDMQQKLISTKPVSKVICYPDASKNAGEGYLDSLTIMYEHALSNIRKSYPAIDLFKPSYLSFCDFRESCELISITKGSGTSLLFQNKKYPVLMLKDRANSGIYGNEIYDDHDVIDHYISSVRTYKAKNITLVVPHLSTRTETAWETDSISGEMVEIPYEGKEYKKDIPFSSITKTVYEEPMIHHGYSYDVFVVVKP